MCCTGMGLNNVDDSKEGICKFKKRNPDTCFVAEDLGKITGVILTGNDGRRGCIYHTSVSPKYRSQRIGSQLLQQALNALKLEGINKVALAVYGYNA